MKNKIIISTLAIFIMACCLAAVYAEEAHLGSFNFNVPDGLKITDSSSSNVFLEGNGKEIIVTTEYTDLGSITKYLKDKGFQYGASFSGESSTVSANGSSKGSYSYDTYSFSKGSESANGYVLNKNGVNFAVIVIDHSGSSSTPGFVMDVDVSRIINDIMFD